MKKVIICALTYNLMPEFCIFYESLLRVNAPTVYVIPLNFTPSQMEQLTSYEKIQTIGLPDGQIDIWQSSFGDHWPQYIKPYLIQTAIDHLSLSEEYLLLWLDVDTVILKPLDEIFTATQQDFLIIKDFFGPTHCQNKPELYELYPSNIQEEDEKLVINSGVVGFSLPRDQYILDRWINNSSLVISNPDLKEHIILYDQGVLLWALRDLGIINKASNHKIYNYPPKRNCYEYSSSLIYYEPNDPRLVGSINRNLVSKRPNDRWPFDSNPFGGDTIQEIKYDNRTAHIVHFAGIPKLSHLCQVDHDYTNGRAHKTVKDCFGIRLKYGYNPKCRLFNIGLERCGTHTIAAIVRNSASVETWVRHEHHPNLVQEAFAKHQGLEYDKSIVNDKIESYKRSDAMIIMESNHRLAFFLPELTDTIPTAQFILSLRHPMDILTSRLRNATMWEGAEHLIPDHLSIYKSICTNSLQTCEFNAFRIKPKPQMNDLSLIELHAWEITHTLDMILKDLEEYSNDQYKVVWIEDQTMVKLALTQICPNLLDSNKLKKSCSIKNGVSNIWDTETEKWFQEQINSVYDSYLDKFLAILRNHRIQILPIFV